MLTLSRPIATRLLKQAQSSPDQFICGLLLARDGVADEIRPLRNTAADASREYRFDADEYASAVSAAAAEGLSPMALYYSHPHSPPVPSADDLAARPAAKLPQLVISLDIKGVLEMRAYTPDGDSVSETTVQIFE